MKRFYKDHSMKLEIDLGERIVSGMNTVIHCHHYNSRIQKTIEGSKMIQGKAVFKLAAAKAFFRQCKNAASEFSVNSFEDKAMLVSELYSFLGFGLLDTSKLKEGIVTSPCSHFAEGWKSGQKHENRKVCSFTEGYLEGALQALFGKGFDVEEVACVNQGAKFCEFKVTEGALKQLEYFKGNLSKAPAASVPGYFVDYKAVTNVDLLGIQKAVFGMPIFGNDLGIIPAFNVYLAHMPRDFYNLVCIEFIEEMAKKGMGEVARELLEEDAETCSLNTFAGIMQSEEWAALIEPMIKQTSDNMYALVAVSNALGWGITIVEEHTPYQSLKLRTSNGYEAMGAKEIIGLNIEPECPMLSGVASGLMSLVYGSGDFDCRTGAYKTKETECISKGSSHCGFLTIIASDQIQRDSA